MCTFSLKANMDTFSLHPNVHTLVHTRMCTLLKVGRTDCKYRRRSHVERNVLCVAISVD